MFRLLLHKFINSFTKYFRESYQQVSISKAERARRYLIIKEGMKSEFWTILKLELLCAAQNESDFSSKQLVLGNEKVALRSAMLSAAILKVVNTPYLIMSSNQDVILEVEKLSNPNKEENKNEQFEHSSRFTR